jgi:hypothetical protein
VGVEAESSLVNWHSSQNRPRRSQAFKDAAVLEAAVMEDLPRVLCSQRFGHPVKLLATACSGCAPAAQISLHTMLSGGWLPPLMLSVLAKTTAGKELAAASRRRTSAQERRLLRKPRSPRSLHLLAWCVHPLAKGQERRKRMSNLASGGEDVGKCALQATWTCCGSTPIANRNQLSRNWWAGTSTWSFP